MVFNTKNKGFTLIELMIVVAIIGILSMIALPAYQKYIDKVRMAEYISIVSNQLRKAYTTQSTGDFTYAAESWTYNNFDVEGCIDTGYSTGMITDKNRFILTLSNWGINNDTTQWLKLKIGATGRSSIYNLVSEDSSCHGSTLQNGTISPYSYLARISVTFQDTNLQFSIGSSPLPSIDGEDKIFCYINNMPNPSAMTEALRILPKSCHYIYSGTAGIIPLPQ